MKWFDLRFVDFWAPILSPQEKWWRDSHIVAHVLGGMVWDALCHFVILASLTGVWVDFRHSALLRIVAVGLWQLTAWEAVQRENWRPELQGLSVGHGYPWLSAIWDTLFTMLGALILEGVLWLV